jgi:hypothetical protein
MSDYLNKTMLGSYTNLLRVEEDGEVEYVATMTMIFKDGTRATEIIETIDKKDYFLYKMGAKKYDPYRKFKEQDGS